MMWVASSVYDTMTKIHVPRVPVCLCKIDDGRKWALFLVPVHLAPLLLLDEDMHEKGWHICRQWPGVSQIPVLVCVDGRKMFKFNGGNVERTIYETVFLQLTVWVDGL